MSLAIITPDDLRYPQPKPYNEGMLVVGDGHRLRYVEFGNPKGVPVLLIHGGPGEGLSFTLTMARMWDPSYFRVITYDQRGCGQSVPHFADSHEKSLHQNNPEKLVEDIEVLRRYLKIVEWHVSGGSWGATLSLLYATAYPSRVLSLLLRSPWMHRTEDIDWYINQMGRLFPEAEQILLSNCQKACLTVMTG